MSRAGSVSPSRTKSVKSIVSHTSISIKLPSSDVDVQLTRDSPVHVRSLSPSRQPSAGTKHNGVPSARGFSPHSSGTVPPQGTPTRPLLNDKEIEQILAARCIEKCWLAYRDRQMFKLLKHAICAAEHSLSHEILRKVSPQEAQLVKDKCSQAKLRFRFAGKEYPPLIYFKVYSCNTNGIGVKYVSGKKMIQPASEAARDACDLMGHRLFYEQMLQDMMRHDEHKITDEVDVTTLKDYMQYLSLLDETPCYMGGRDNGWRKLTLEVLPRHTVFYDVIGYLYSHKMTPQLREELPTLLKQPTTEDLQLQHIRILSHIRTPPAPLPTPKGRDPRPGQTGRRSQQARLRANRMRRAYGEQRVEGEEGGEGLDPGEEVRGYSARDEEAGEEEEWEKEAEDLYEWTQQLTLDDIVGTPRLTTAMTTVQ